uniref:O-acyltransferase like n=1 Tax=Scleropages formosus TaxID=113540 RepID=A0A8C9V890_SCLFO
KMTAHDLMCTQDFRSSQLKNFECKWGKTLIKIILASSLLFSPVYDAFGKIASDIVGGNMNRPGSLQECLSVRAPHFRGRYCQVFIKQDPVQYFVGICVPDSCEEDEVQTLTSLIPPVPSVLLPKSTQAFYITHCVKNTLPPDISTLCLTVLWLSPVGHLFDSLYGFSLQNTSAGVLSTTGSRGRYSSLNGIRVLSLLWIISGHSVQISAWYNLDNNKRWKERVEKNPLYIFAFSGPVYLAVDTFLLLGGLLSAKSLLSTIQRADDKLSPGIAILPSIALHVSTRVQPLHIFIVCLVIGFLSVIPEGSFWFIVEDQILSCKKYWWSNLLLMNNLLTVTDICAPWTWYLSIDFQFYITTPLVIFIYRLNKHVLLAFVTILLVISCLTRHTYTYFQYYYNKPYTRYGPYLVGILAGIFLKTGKQLGWVISLSVMALIAGLPYALRLVPSQPSGPLAVYQGLHRTLWAMAVAWIIVACEEGYGGLINKILSLNVWVPLSNISFACYLIHPILIILYNGEQDTPIHYTDINFFYLFVGHMVLAVILGYVFTVLIEKPYLFLKRCDT